MTAALALLADIAHTLAGIMVLCGFLGVVACFIAPFMQPRGVWNRTNKRVLLSRNPLARRAIDTRHR